MDRAEGARSTYDQQGDKVNEDPVLKEESEGGTRGEKGLLFS
jgi:hypothetical protein